MSSEPVSHQAILMFWVQGRSQFKKLTILFFRPKLNFRAVLALKQSQRVPIAQQSHQGANSHQRTGNDYDKQKFSSRNHGSPHNKKRQEQRLTTEFNKVYQSQKLQEASHPRDAIQVMAPQCYNDNYARQKDLRQDYQKETGKEAIRHNILPSKLYLTKTRLNLILMVLEQGQSCTKACELLRVKLTTGCLILRTFKATHKVMKKKDPQTHKKTSMQAQSIRELESRVQLLIQRLGAVSSFEKSQDANSGPQNDCLSNELQKREQKEEKKVKQEHFPQEDNDIVDDGLMRIDERSVKMEQLSSQREAVGQAEERLAGWILPTIVYYPWLFFPK